MPRQDPSLLADVAWAVRAQIYSRFRRRLFILKCERPAYATAEPGDGITVARYGPGDERPAALSDTLAAKFGRGFPAADATERAEGSTLWVGSLGGEAVAFVRSRPGNQLKNWHERLGPDDRLVYAMATHRTARGRGVSTALLRAAVSVLPEGGTAWSDTMKWNAPALAALRNAGFRPLYEADSLPDHPD